MRSSEAVNRPRWLGQAGFFEIWFLVLFEPEAERAWWFRYTTMAPTRPTDGPARAIVWAAAFDGRAAVPAVAAKRILPIREYDPGGDDGFGIRMGPAALGQGECRGTVHSPRHRIEWELRFTPAEREAYRGPRFDWLPLPTRVAHANAEVTFSGWVTVDGVGRELRSAPGLQKHIWGTRTAEDLFWLCCPRFAEDPHANLEAISVRLRPGPRLAPVWLRTGAGAAGAPGMPWLFWNRAESAQVGHVRFRAATLTRALTARAWCDPRTLVGYVYRDPDGTELHVAQSDLASCQVELFARSHPLASWKETGRLTSSGATAIEFHQPAPLPGVRYIPWDAAG